MKFKKFFAAVLAGAVALSSFSLSASAASSDTGGGATANTTNEPVKIELATSISTGAALEEDAGGSAGSNIDVPTTGVDGLAIKKVVVEFDADKITADYFNGIIGANKTGDDWYQSDQLAYPENNTWSWDCADGIVGNIQVQFWWINKVQDDTNTPGTVAIKSVTMYDENDNVLAIAAPKAATETPDPGDDVSIEILFDKSKDITFNVVDASGWGNPDFTKAAQAEFLPVIDGITTGTTTYGDLKTKTVKLTGVDFSGFTFPEGITAADVSVSLCANWGSSWTWNSGSASGWDLSTIENVADDDVVQKLGYQLTINGDKGGINDMDIDDTIKLTLKSSGEEPGGETPTIPEGTKLVAEANQWSSGALQTNVAATVPGITNWTTTAAEADEILGGKAITFKLPINGAISNGSTFDLSKISVSAFMQTNATPGMWISKNATKGEDGVYTMVIDNYAESLKATSGEVNIGVQISISEADAAGAESVDIYVGALTVEVAGGSTEEPGDTTSKVLWEGTQDFGEWANSVEIANSKLGELNAGDKIVISFTPSEGAQLSLKYNDTNWPGLPDFGDAEWHSVDVTTSPYTYTLTANDITALGTFSLIVSGQKAVATKVELVSAGGSGTTTPGGDNPGGGNPGTPNIPSRPSTPSTSEPEETVKFEDGKNQTGAVVEAPKDAFEADVTFNAAPVAEETKDDKFTFELNFTDKDGNKVQPKSEVTVKIPVPAALSGKTVYVYHIEENGTYTEISCKIEDGMVVFSAKSFSKYVITSQKLNANGEPVAEQPGTSDPGTSNPGSTNEPNANTGAGGAAAVLGITAIAAGAMIVSKKRK